MAPGNTAGGSLYLVDAHALIFQVFHAIRGMSSPSSLPTNALFGFTRDLLFLRGLQPDYLVCAFDRPEPTFRSELYPEYKAHREPMPNDLALQLPFIHRALEALAIPVVSHPRYEADDVLATLARAGSARGLDVFLCTSDKDCRQLIDDRVRLYNLRKRQPFGRAELLADWGVTPEQVVDLQALVGDSVDNVPGVPGIGVKTAAKLLQEFGTLNNLLANIDNVPGAKKQEALRAAGAALALSRQLVRLADDVPVEMDWESWRLATIDLERFLALCQECGLHSLASQARAAGRPAPGLSAAGKAASPQQGELFGAGEELFPFGANAPAAQEAAPPPAGDGAPGWKHNYRLIDRPKPFADFLRRLRKQKRFAVDLETTSLQPLDARIVGLAFSWEEGEADYLALRGPEGAPVLNEEEVLDKLRPMFESPDVQKVNQNIKYDLLVLRAHGIEVRNVAGDPMVADYLLHSGERSHGSPE
jgi:DNA polymerase-1